MKQLQNNTNISIYLNKYSLQHSQNSCSISVSFICKLLPTLFLVSHHIKFFFCVYTNTSRQRFEEVKVSLTDLGNIFHEVRAFF